MNARPAFNRNSALSDLCNLRRHVDGRAHTSLGQSPRGGVVDTEHRRKVAVADVVLGKVGCELFHGQIIARCATRRQY